MWVCVDDSPPHALNFFFRKGHFDQRFFSSTRSIITATADDRRRRHSKIIELIQSRPPQNPLFFHSWALLVSLTLADQPSFSGLRTLVLLSFPYLPLFLPQISLLASSHDLYYRPPYAGISFALPVILWFPLVFSRTRWIRARAYGPETIRPGLMSSSSSSPIHFELLYVPLLVKRWII